MVRADQQAASEQTDITPHSALRRRRRRRNIVLAAVLLLAVGGGYYWQRQGQEVQQTQPLIATVEVGTIENTIPATGSLKPRNFVDVGAQVSGQLEVLHVEVGEKVEEGDLLAEIDARVQQNRVESSRANIESLEAQLEARRASLQLARANAERQKRLMEADATSQLDYDNAMNNLASAEASLIQLEKQIEQSRASLSTDETQLEYTRIYAPTSGTVVSIEMNEGRTLNASQQAPTILRIADLSTMTVETQISEADIGRIKAGMEVYFTTLGSGDRRWYGELRQIRPTPVVENNVVLYTGLFEVDNPDGALLPEMTAQVYFVTSSAEDVLTVPLGALSFNEAPKAGPDGAPPGGGGPSGRLSGNFPGGAVPGASGGNAGRRLAMVTVVNEDGTMAEREVMIGVTSRIAAEVVSGLEAGDRVVAGMIQNVASGEEGDDDRRRGFRMRF